MVELEPKIQHDGEIYIATGRNRKEFYWQNKKTLWSEFVAKLREPIRTRETLTEYQNMSKTQQGEAKDVGGFVGGVLVEGKRKTGSVKNRYFITLDMDAAPIGFRALLVDALSCGFTYYSTHSHTPDKPRIRVILPLDRAVSPEEYEAISRALAAKIGIMFFDPTTYEPHRLMYWPSVSADGEYLTEYFDWPWLSVDEILSEYPDWKDVSFWPEADQEKLTRKREKKKQGDPTEKPGLIGAFCRRFSIPEAIETFIPESYEFIADDRATYLAGSAVGGLKLYDGGLYAYSHHGTDPISGKLVNAFDLVRIHKFGKLDDNIPEGTRVDSLPSHKAMLEFALKDPELKRFLTDEKIDHLKDDFGESPEDEEALRNLDFNTRGALIANMSNLLKILRHDKKLRGIRADLHRNNLVRTQPLDWVETPGDWSDTDEAQLRAYLEVNYAAWQKGRVTDALIQVSQERAFHPIKEYLESLNWDGKPRLNTALVECLGATDCQYTRAVTRKVLLAAVARIYEPGVKFDQVLVVCGPQGIGKTTFFLRLGGRWHTDSLTFADMRDKTAAEKLRGAWIVEISELAGIRKTETEAIKSFASRQVDYYRPAYARNVIEQPRQCVLVATTNTQNFLRDTTGNRRFWPIIAHGGNPGSEPWILPQEYYNQLWAETLYYYRTGEGLCLDRKLQAEAADRQRSALELDERVDLVADYLAKKLPENWAELREVYDRRTHLRGNEEGPVEREKVCAAEVWEECFELPLRTITQKDTIEIIRILEQIHCWKPAPGSGKLRFEHYGLRKAFIKEKE